MAQNPDGVPGISASLYRGLVEFASGTPDWVHLASEIITDGLPIMLVVLLLLNWWRARGAGGRALPLALLALAATALSYLVSEAIKTGVGQERPCQSIDVVMIVACDPIGDYSFPSNHTTFATAAAVGLAMAWRRVATWVLVSAVVTAFSRVFVGAHYPHDVIAGLVLGTLVAYLVMRFGVAPMGRLTDWAAGVPALRWAVATGPVPAAVSPSPAEEAVGAGDAPASREHTEPTPPRPVSSVPPPAAPTTAMPRPPADEDATTALPAQPTPEAPTTALRTPAGSAAPTTALRTPPPGPEEAVTEALGRPAPRRPAVEDSEADTVHLPVVRPGRDRAPGGRPDGRRGQPGEPGRGERRPGGPPRDGRPVEGGQPRGGRPGDGGPPREGRVVDGPPPGRPPGGQQPPPEWGEEPTTRFPTVR
ncbi:phosphatase PAP2 family protein [Actinoalloteichus caeruleus]|uniref:phosphatase PAP2 family protein n=1 Tax=Actinoalloteichus cyanogriseus TaxID=2893586 RepID=UPI00068D32EC|nr:phosphatase PAP2 family protein [Actinoalloteichus caeruleus]